MILGFKPKFKDKILNGSKIHTIRFDQHKRWKVGMSIQFATGVRTKNYECFKRDAFCLGIQKIVIKHNKGDFKQTGVWIDDKLIFAIDGVLHNGTDIMTKLAKNDGFNDYNDFFKWFNKDFEGFIIHWTDFKY